MKLSYRAACFLIRALARIIFRIRVRGQENVPFAGGFILASNHISYYDPPLVGSFFHREIHFMAKKELFRNRFFGAMIRHFNSHPVNRLGIDRQAIETALTLLKSGEGLLIFPEGTRSKGEGFLSPRPGIAMIAMEAVVPIVPAYIHGSNALKECFLGKKRMGIVYGTPLAVDEIARFGRNKEGYQQLAASVMERIGALRAGFLGGGGS